MQGGLAGPPRNPPRQRSIVKSCLLPTVRSLRYRAANVALRQRPPEERELLRFAFSYRSSSSFLGLLAALSICSHSCPQALMLPRYTTLPQTFNRNSTFGSTDTERGDTKGCQTPLRGDRGPIPGVFCLLLHEQKEGPRPGLRGKCDRDALRGRITRSGIGRSRHLAQAPRPGPRDKLHRDAPRGRRTAPGIGNNSRHLRKKSHLGLTEKSRISAPIHLADIIPQSGGDVTLPWQLAYRWLSGIWPRLNAEPVPKRLLRSYKWEEALCRFLPPFLVIQGIQQAVGPGGNVVVHKGFDAVAEQHLIVIQQGKGIVSL